MSSLNLFDKVFLVSLVSTATALFVVFLRLNQHAGRTPPKREEKRSHLGFQGLYYLIFEPLLGQVRSTVFELVETKSPKAFMPLLRYARYILSPNSYCSFCGRKVREYWKPILEALVDPIGMEQDLKPLDPVQILCRSCSPSFFGFNEDKRSGLFYIV